MTAPPRPATLHVALALLAVYVIWGSTYVAIVFAIDTLPPFLMAGVRFLVAGGVLYVFLRMRGHPAPTSREWISAAVVGTLLLGVGNGGLSWAEQHVPSSVAALILAGVPAWMVLFDWMRRGGRRPGGQELLGVALGLVGIAVLMGGDGGMALDRADTVGAVVVVLASLAWAYGSVLSRSLPVPRSFMILTAMQMLAAGVVLVVTGAVAGEFGRVDPGSVSLSSVLALAYLVVFGSWVGYSAYIWLLRSTTPAVASSYAFVNPTIAVLLGWLLAGESVDSRMVGAMGVIIVGVALIVLRPRGTGPVIPPGPPAAATRIPAGGRGSLRGPVGPSAKEHVGRG